MFFSSSSCVWGLLGGLEKGEKQDSQVCGLWEAWGRWLEQSHRNLLSTHESCGWKRFLPRVPELTQRQGLEPPTAESLVLLQTWWGTVIFRSEEMTQPVRASTVLAEDLTPSSTLTCTHLTTAYMHTIKNKIFKKLHVCTLAEDPCSVLSTHTWQL